MHFVVHGDTAYFERIISCGRNAQTAPIIARTEDAIRREQSKIPSFGSIPFPNFSDRTEGAEYCIR